MNRSLIWFSILYGELNALVVLVVVGGLWVNTPSGARFCAWLSLDAGLCRGGIMGLVVLSLGLTSFLTFKRLLEERRKSKSLESEAAVPEQQQPLPQSDLEHGQAPSGETSEEGAQATESDDVLSQEATPSAHAPSGRTSSNRNRSRQRHG